MGKWSQYRHRGSVAPGATQPATFPLDAPKDDEWELGPGGTGEVLADLIGGVCAVGADGWEFTYSLAGNPPDLTHILGQGCGDQVDFFPPSGSYDGFARWTSGGVVVSDWSVPKFFVV